MNIVIVGAGLAGLLAANMLKGRHSVKVVERQDSLPNNHSAVLRFRTPLVSEVLGIPFRKVTVVKGVAQWKNSVADALAYSFKNTGSYRSDRSVVNSSGVAERWIAPPDLIARMAEGLDVEYGTDFDYFPASLSAKVISTVPMPNVMRVLDYPKRRGLGFGVRAGTNVLARIADCDAYVSLAVPDPELPFSRVSITGDQLIAECPISVKGNEGWATNVAVEACDLLGVPTSSLGEIEWRSQQYAKILPVDETERRRFLHWCSAERGYCWNLGRFATWRPGLLMDDLVNDVRVITKLMESGSSAYDAERLYAEKEGD